MVKTDYGPIPLWALRFILDLYSVLYRHDRQAEVPVTLQIKHRENVRKVLVSNKEISASKLPPVKVSFRSRLNY